MMYKGKASHGDTCTDQFLMGKNPRPDGHNDHAQLARKGTPAGGGHKEHSLVTHLVVTPCIIQGHLIAMSDAHKQANLVESARVKKGKGFSVTVTVAAAPAQGKGRLPGHAAPVAQGAVAVVAERGLPV
jgi:hypothetical protein